MTTSAWDSTEPVDLDALDLSAELAAALREHCEDPERCLRCKDRYMAVWARTEPIIEHHKERRQALTGELEQARLAEQRARDLAHHWKTNGNTALHDQHAAQLLAALDGDGSRPAVMTSADLNGTFERIAGYIDQWRDGEIAPQDALNGIHEQVGDR